MNRREILVELGLEDAIVFEKPDYDSAIIGYDAISNRVVYDYDRMVQHLMDNHSMTYEEASDFISHNSSFMSEHDHPIILIRIDDYADYVESTTA